MAKNPPHPSSPLAPPAANAPESAASAEPEALGNPDMRPSAIASAPEPKAEDPALVDEAPAAPAKPALVRCLVTHGTVRRNGEEYKIDDIVELPADEAARFEAAGVIKRLRKLIDA